MKADTVPEQMDDMHRSMERLAVAMKGGKG